MVTPACNLSWRAPGDFETTLQTLRDAIAGADMVVLGEIDTGAVMRRANMEAGNLRQVMFFHPRFMRRVLEAAPAAMVEAPLKFSVRDTAEGVFCHALRPRDMFGRYVGLEELARDLDDVLERIIAAARLTRLAPER